MPCCLELAMDSNSSAIDRNAEAMSVGSIEVASVLVPLEAVNHDGCSVQGVNHDGTGVYPRSGSEYPECTDPGRRTSVILMNECGSCVRKSELQCPST